MGMNVGSNQDDDVMLDVNMTPLIDVMLVLLIMFIITIPLPNNSINIDLPNGTPPVTDENRLSWWNYVWMHKVRFSGMNSR